MASKLIVEVVLQDFIVVKMGVVVTTITYKKAVEMFFLYVTI